jgi:hypothetical protein
LDSRYTKAILNGDYKIHEELKPYIDENGAKHEPYYILITEMIEKLNRREYLINQITEVTENIYMDAYKGNVSLIERKEDALKDILGFL